MSGGPSVRQKYDSVNHFTPSRSRCILSVGGDAAAPLGLCSQFRGALAQPMCFCRSFPLSPDILCLLIPSEKPVLSDAIYASRLCKQDLVFLYTFYWIFHYLLSGCLYLPLLHLNKILHRERRWHGTTSRLPHAVCLYLLSLSYKTATSPQQKFFSSLPIFNTQKSRRLWNNRRVSPHVGTMKVTIKSWSFPSPPALPTMASPSDHWRSSLLERQKRDITNLLAHNSSLRDKEINDRVKRDGNKDRVPRSITPPTWIMEEIENAQENREIRKTDSKPYLKSAYKGALALAIPPWTGPDDVDILDENVDPLSPTFDTIGSPTLPPGSLKIPPKSRSSSREPLRDITPPSWVLENKAYGFGCDGEDDVHEDPEGKLSAVSPLHRDSSLSLESVGNELWGPEICIEGGARVILDRASSHDESNRGGSVSRRMEEVENSASYTDNSTQESLIDLEIPAPFDTDTNYFAANPALFELLGLNVDGVGPHPDLEVRGNVPGSRTAQVLPARLSKDCIPYAVALQLAKAGIDFEEAFLFTEYLVEGGLEEYLAGKDDAGEHPEDDDARKAKEDFLNHAKDKEDTEITQALEDDFMYRAAHRVIVSNIAAGADEIDIADMFKTEMIPVHEVRMLKERELRKRTQVALVDLHEASHLEHAECMIGRIFGLKVEIRRAVRV
ncbi:hypothetical protein BDV96DRAFT_249302 [Lophiotrema nucula]|uniref:Uncharacterized protein n=1 Tax=Lophiotrema nucula TaxID=690887 RepID=A0A6A5YPJ5_9PLEO|nr:hypothetical protein BDV96DRAFT_249302 [Lophiotrema nucula]